MKLATDNKEFNPQLVNQTTLRIVYILTKRQLKFISDVTTNLSEMNQQQNQIFQ